MAPARPAFEISLAPPADTRFDDAKYEADDKWPGVETIVWAGVYLKEQEIGAGVIIILQQTRKQKESKARHHTLD